MLINRAARISLVLMITALMMAGCAGTQKQKVSAGTYKALAIAGNTYDAAMKGIADLHRNGHVGDEEKAEAVRLGGFYFDAYHAAVESLKTYVETDVETPADLQSKLLAVGAALGKLLAYINPLLNKYGMEVIQ